MPTNLNISSASELKAFVHSKLWGSFCNLADQMIRQWQNEPGRGETVDEYLITSLKRDGRVEGVRAFVAELEKYAKK